MQNGFFNGEVPLTNLRFAKANAVLSLSLSLLIEKISLYFVIFTRIVSLRIFALVSLLTVGFLCTVMLFIVR